MLSCRHMTTTLENRVTPLLKPVRRALWAYVATAFNRVDQDRLKLVGPDRLCAEWLLKNGGAIRMVEAPSKLWKDYNALPPASSRFCVKEADATGASVMKIGLEHFKDCRYIDTVIFHECKHLEEDGLQGLLHLKDSLQTLQVSGCSNIPDKGLEIIGELKNLRLLKIFDMNYVKNLEAVLKNLQSKLPDCKVESKK